MKYTFFEQYDSMDCGPACLKMVSEYHGGHYKIDFLRELCSLTKQGASMQGLSQAADVIGLRSLAVQISLDELKEKVPLPCILHWTQNHYVVLFEIKGKKSGKKSTFVIGDPAFGVTEIGEDEFLRSWISSSVFGVALVFEKGDSFQVTENTEKAKRSVNGFVKYLKPHKFKIGMVFLTLLIGSLLTLVIPFLMQRLVDTGILQRKPSIVTLILLAQFVLFSAIFINEFIRTRILLFINNYITINILSDFLTKLFKLPLYFFDSKTIGDLSQRIGDHGRIQSFLTGASIITAFSLLNLIVYSAVLLYYDFSIFFIFMGFMALNIGWTLLFLKRRKKLDFLRFQKAAENQNIVYEMVANVQEIKVQNIEQKKRWMWEGSQRSLNELSVKLLNLNQSQNAGTSLLMQFSSIVVTYVSAMAVINGEISLGVMMTIAYIVGQMRAPVEQTVEFIVSAQNARLSFLRLNEIYEVQDEDSLDTMQHVRQNDGKLKDQENQKGIEIRNLSFKYPGASEYLFEKLNLSIHPNKITAIVGASGSGKTTLLKLLLRYYKIDEGEIMYNGMDIGSLSAAYWRGQCGILMQEGHIFSDSIKENIIMTEDVADKDKLEFSLRQANIDEFVNGLALKEDTLIGKNGLNVSAGQKQRILLARIIYKDPKIVILDEATSALDTKNEKEIMEHLNVFFENKTVIIVAHRLSTIRNADNIVVLEAGKVVEQGSHEVLSELKGTYHKLIQSQLTTN